MTKRYDEMTRAELIIARADLNQELERLGREYDQADPCSFTIIDNQYCSTKQDLGDQIYRVYAALGAVMKASERINGHFG